MKEYIYDRKLYIFDVIITGGISVITSIVSFVLILSNFLPLLMLLFFITGVYSSYNCFIAKVHPEKIILNDTEINFYSFGDMTQFDVNELESFKIREFPTAGKLYIRIFPSSTFKRKYWVNTKAYNDSQELFFSLLELEYIKHPETLKATARRVNTLYLERKGMKNK